MSFAQQKSDDSTDSAANNDDDGSFAPRPITGRYLSVQAHLGLLKDAIGAVEAFSMDDTDLPAVKWAKAIEAALYSDDGCLGEQQGETPYTTAQFKETYGDSITTPHDDLTSGERAELLELFQNSDNHSGDDLKDEFKLPVINGERLPLLVADEDVLSEALEQLEAIVEEGDNGTHSTPDEVDDEPENDAEFPVLEGTLNDLDAHLADSTPNEETLREMLEAEKDGKDRKGGKKRLEAAIEERSTPDDDDDEPEADDDDDTDADSTTNDGGLTDEQIEKVATATATAVASTLSEMDF